MQRQAKRKFSATTYTNGDVQLMERPMELGQRFPNILACNPGIKQHILCCKPLYEHTGLKYKLASYQQTLLFPILLYLLTSELLVRTWESDFRIDERAGENLETKTKTTGLGSEYNRTSLDMKSEQEIRAREWIPFSTRGLLFLCSQGFWLSISCHFPSAWGTSGSNSYSAGQLATSSPGLGLSPNASFPHHQFWKISPWRRILDEGFWRFSSTLADTVFQSPLFSGQVGCHSYSGGGGGRTVPPVFMLPSPTAFPCTPLVFSSFTLMPLAQWGFLGKWKQRIYPAGVTGFLGSVRLLFWDKCG